MIFRLCFYLLVSCSFIGLFSAPANGQPGQVLNERIEPNWLPGGSSFWYRRQLPEGNFEFRVVDGEAKENRALFDHAKVAKALSEKLQREVRAERLPIEQVHRASAKEVVFATDSDDFSLSLEDYSISDATESLPERPRAERLDSIEKSGPSNRRAPIRFINRLDKPLKVFWIDPDGGRADYGEVAASESHEIPSYAGHVWVLTDPSGRDVACFRVRRRGRDAIIDADTVAPKVKSDDPPQASEAPKQNPGVDVGGFEISVRARDLVVKEKSTGKETLFNQHADPTGTFQRDASWARLVNMDYDAKDFPEGTPEIIPSPDGKYIIAIETIPAEENRVYMVEAMPREQLQPKLHSYPYLKPGQPIPQQRLHLISLSEGKEIAVDATLFAQPWRLENFRWKPDSSSFTFEYNQRGHQIYRILSIEVATGKVNIVVDEVTPSFFDYQGKHFAHYIDRTNELIWMSERDGWNHLYLIDLNSGVVKNQITKGEWVVQRVVRVLEESRELLVQVGGVQAGEDPYFRHYIRVNFDGSGLVDLTPSIGDHEMTISPDGRYLVDSFSQIHLAPTHLFRDAKTGVEICSIETADASRLTQNRILPEPFVAKGRDGKTDIYGIIYRPRGFDEQKKYPVIESIYAGPHDFHVPKSFRPRSGQQNMADEGFIVVQIDGMGTSGRSKAFHDVCYKNIVDGGFPDRIAWMKQAAEKYPQLDITRVGIYGGSAGGQNAAAAVLTHPDFYDAAAADCGCHDNRMDKIWWNELWMSWPDTGHYEAQSNVTLAKNLQGKLMLTVGELDRNVDPASTYQLAAALQKANKDYELLIIPGGGHGSGESPYAARKRVDFFKKNLQE